MNNEIKEILDKWKCYIGLTKKISSNDMELLRVEDIEKVLDYITNLQQKIEQYENPDDMTLFYMWLDTKAKDKIKELQQENEKLKAQLTDTEWEYQNTRCKYEKQYKKGITEELLKDIETCFFNRENPSIIPIDSLDICHIFGYIDYLKDYKSRCEKAIEYIQNNMQYDDNIDDNWVMTNDLLNILQNGSENNG